MLLVALIANCNGTKGNLAGQCLDFNKGVDPTS